MTARHGDALRWFMKNAETEATYAELYCLGLVMGYKAIYKPRGADCALSVRALLNGDYPDDDDRRFLSDGTWLFRYHQEGHDPSHRDDEYTNRSLMDCMRLKVPVGVLLQTADKPVSRYKVLGLALVDKWDTGFFFLSGPVNYPVAA